MPETLKKILVKRGCKSVTSLGGGRPPPGDTIQVMTPEWKKMWLNLERKLETLDKRRRKVGVVTRRQLKKVITL